MEFDPLFRDKEFIAYSGTGLMERTLDHLGFDALTAAAMPEPDSNRDYRR